MQKVRSQACLRVALELLVGMWFQILFTPLSGFFSPFPRGTCSLSVEKSYLALSDGPDRFRQDFTCPVLLGVSTRPEFVFAYETITLFGLPFFRQFR
jgi:hypothetical protein